jgi:hypothetical protein
VPLKTRTGIEIARTGEWNTSRGKWNCTRSQLADAVRAAKSGRFRNPVLRRGHVDPRFAGDAVISEDGEPALGQVRNLRLADDGDVLVGDLLVPDWLDDELDAIYPSRSVEADLGVETVDGETFSMVTTGLALLGVTKPAIQSLAELPERIAASEYTSAMSVAAGFFDEAAHPRGGKGSAAGGKFVAKGSGYSKDGKGGEAGTVKEVQSELLRLGLLSPDSGKNGGKDGLFGPKTEAAVKKWQTDHGQTPTGKVSDQLLKTLKLAKKGDHGEAQRKADGGKETAAEKRAKMKPTAPKAPHVLTHRTARVKAAAEAAAPDGFDVREITPDTVVYDDTDGRVWMSAWSGDDDTVTVAEPAPAVVTYTPLAASAEGMAAHALHSRIQWARGWEPSTIQASEGDTSLDITPKLREALGIDENADEAAVLAAIEGLKTPAEPPANTIQETATVEPPASSAAPNAPADGTENPARELVAASAVEALVAEKVAAALAPIQASHTVYEAKIADLSGWKAERLAQEVVTTKTSVINAAAQQGKFAPAERATWEAEYDKAPDTVTRILASMKPGTAVPVAASGYAGDGTETTDDFAEFEKAFNWGGAK